MQDSANPILATVARGGIAESVHRGSYAVVDATGALVASGGNIEQQVFPRSAIKAFQCLPLLELGGVERFGLLDEEIALACASHSGEGAHVDFALSMLHKAGNREEDLECGPHRPIAEDAYHALVRAGVQPGPLHNNCSGKHAGMLALAKLMGAPTAGYVAPEHPVQQRISETMSNLCGVDMQSAPCGIDGCSVPTWAIPLRHMAAGFARFCDAKNSSAQQIIRAVGAHPFLVAGTARFDTRLMQSVPRAFIKTGAEGVYGACVPDAGIGIALKCDDGASRASQLVIAAVLASLGVWSRTERKRLEALSCEPVVNHRGVEVGSRRVVELASPR